MPMLLNNPELEEAIIADRRERGLDRLDEVWEGVYVMAPMANDEHQELVGRFVSVLTNVVDFAGLGKVRPGVNVSDSKTDWTENFRCPDVVVYLNDTKAENCQTHWYGGPDFAVEIVSRHDRSREKLEFYASVGTRELLIIDRDPWQMELFRLIDGKLTSVIVATVANALVAHSDVVPITLQFVHGDARPGIAVTANQGQRWTL